MLLATFPEKAHSSMKRIVALVLFLIARGLPAWAQPSSPNPGPTAVISASASGSFEGESVTITVTFSEDVSGLSPVEIQVENAKRANPVVVSASVYTVDLIPKSGGVITAWLPSGAAQSARGNGNQASNLFSIDYTGMPSGHCASFADLAGQDWIKRVTLFDGANTLAPILLDQLSSKTGGYADYTAVDTVSLYKTSTYTVRIRPGRLDETRLEAYRVWIDYNRDGLFFGDGELVYARNLTDLTSVWGTFVVPDTALAGITRMRVQLKHDQVPFSPCENFSRGEVEDYAIRLEEAVPLMLSEGSAEQLRIAPNPAVSEARFYQEFPSSQPYTVRLLDMQGREWYRQAYAPSSRADALLPLQGLPAGLYLGVVEQASGLQSVSRLLVLP
jgi:hypothetical protein